MAEWVTCWTGDRVVLGSNPAEATYFASEQCLIQDKISTSPSPTDRRAVVAPRGRRAARSRTVVTLGDIFT